MSWFKYPRYVSVAEKKERAMKKITLLKKKNPAIKPVIINGNSLAKTWWGKSWNANLEGYADFSNRMGRGRSYVRHGAVLDLQITEGRIEALVQGSTSKPYEVVITIRKLSQETAESIKSACQGKLSSLQDLLGGKFPKELSELFLARGTGLFPVPKEIYLSCTCPDWAVMCKHVAATLYGVGARLDEDPLLFFKLRSIEVDELVALAVRERTGDLLSKTEIKSDKVIEDGDLSDLFGIELDDPSSELKPQKVKKAGGSPKKTAAVKKKDIGANPAPEKKCKSTRQADSKRKISAKEKKRSWRDLPENIRKAIEARKKAEEQGKKSAEPEVPKVGKGGRKRVSASASSDSAEQATPQKKKNNRKRSESVRNALKVRKAMLEQEAGTKKRAGKKNASPATKTSAPKNKVKKSPVDVSTIIEQWKQTIGE